MHRMGKKERKQFPLINKENCIIYLCRIISSCELCMDRYKIYNVETEKILEQYKGKEKIPHDIYVGLSDKTGHVMCYLLNLLGDCQTSSIPYFKYRKQVQKNINKGNGELKLNNLDLDVEEALSEFNKLRNWQNHVPESLLVSEVDLIKGGNAVLPTNPMRIIHYNYVSYEYFLDLYQSNLRFCAGARKIIQAAKKDYALLQGKPVSYPRVYSNVPVSLTGFKAAKMSAKAQGLHGDYDDILEMDD